MRTPGAETSPPPLENAARLSPGASQEGGNTLLGSSLPMASTTMIGFGSDDTQFAAAQEKPPVRAAWKSVVALLSLPAAWMIMTLSREARSAIRRPILPFGATRLGGRSA